MSVRVLSADHYGVAQRRRRSIFIGNKIGLENIFPTPTHLNNTQTVKDAFSDMRFDGKNTITMLKQLRLKINLKRSE